MGIQIEAWGDYALFSRPELKTERMSYDIITPSAARGLIESVYWHPGIRIQIDRVYLLPGMNADRNQNPDDVIRFINIRRNEVTSRVSARRVQGMMLGGPAPFLDARTDIQQRASNILVDVHYVIEAHFNLTRDAPENMTKDKVCAMYHNRLTRGMAYAQPYFGCREFPARFREWQGGTIHPVDLTRDLGLMLYDMDYTNPASPQPMYFRARLKHGVMQVAGEEVLR